MFRIIVCVPQKYPTLKNFAIFETAIVLLHIVLRTSYLIRHNSHKLESFIALM